MDTPFQPLSERARSLSNALNIPIVLPELHCGVTGTDEIVYVNSGLTSGAGLVHYRSIGDSAMFE
jgi:hypothetical protein